ncbi:glycoside hydrolase family 19 protein [Mycolicibacterium mucogenicum]|uniref:Lysin A n=1 Tax=Mycolicibacterium mucogenicum DSM 44124 TaxID=1226753 RepID=A0A8H2PEI4_MYCMU|nr:hypothetical protein [Mycolicibacterium mucogenicum]KAB7761169.1 hypothetical protein MMUC44124_00770 [Mycolicibacterium mucogenicum DSM 44124]QPG69971.1 hypothetical protein C1S78_002775 [Mycolicibacterium mucogenicum DSM 44124]
MTFVVTRQRAQEVHDRARARAGLPYDYGGAFTDDPRDSTDCSGLVLQTGAWYGGRTDWQGNRYGSTESFRLDRPIVYDLGFRRMPAGGPAALPFKPVMLVGLMHGGGGENSHTACTLMTMDIPGGPVVMSDRGVDWESHGNVNGVGVSLYGGARAWNDRLFSDFWYLDARLEDAPASPGISGDTLAEAWGRRPGVDYAGLAPGCNEAMIRCGANTVNKSAMFLAQLGHECGGGVYRTEIASGEQYEGRLDLGNTQPGDGRRFRGRSFIQITGRSNVTRLSQWAFDQGYVPTPTYFVDNPEALSSDEHVWTGAVWYFTVARPTFMDAAESGDLEACTRMVNGGLNGLDDRRNYWNRARALGDRILPATPTPTDPLEELLMSDLRVPSLSIYADPGETPPLLVDMLRALDAHGPHEPWVENKARNGHLDSIRRVAQTAAGKGPYGTDPQAVSQAASVMADIEKANPAALQAFLTQNGK